MDKPVYTFCVLEKGSLGGPVVVKANFFEEVEGYWLFIRDGKTVFAANMAETIHIENVDLSCED